MGDAMSKIDPVEAHNMEMEQRFTLLSIRPAIAAIIGFDKDSRVCVTVADDLDLDIIVAALKRAAFLLETKEPDFE
jgi:hypothetical protein